MADAISELDAAIRDANMLVSSLWPNLKREQAVSVREAFERICRAVDGVCDDTERLDWLLNKNQQAIGEWAPGEWHSTHDYSRKFATPREAIDAARARPSLTCTKAEHIGDGFLHAANDDGPYDVDGIQYCGRCHGLAHPPASSDPAARARPAMQVEVAA